MQVLDQCHDLAINPKHTRWISPLLLLADAALCVLITWKIPYTEIDWEAYMQQVEQYINGEKDYTKIKGGTGPLVYPAAHVYTYRVLHSLTDQGRNILHAQVIFGAVYLVTLAVAMACYRRAKAPPYVFPLLILSKRLHSIFLLRCFNDCFAVCALFIAIYAYQRRMWTLGSIAYSWGLGIKMSLLLALPAVGIILLQALGRERALRQAMLMGQLQVLVALPFLRVNAKGYLSRAFEFTRQFLYKWTVNWRFVDEEIFLSKPFSLALLAVHVCLLVLFAATRWTRPSQRSLLDTVRMAFHPSPASVQREISRRITPEYILTTILTANSIGMLCARSLHYQFYSWIAWATPFLLWRAGYHPVLQYAIWAAQEWAWNAYPSTEASSITVVGVLAVTVLGVWWGTMKDYPVLRKEKVPQHSHVE